MDRISWSVLVLAILGLIDSAYLTWVKFTDSYVTCGPIGNCEAVNTSRYAEFAGIPIAIIGILGYLLIIAVVALEKWMPSQKEGLRLAFFGFTLTGTVYSIYLTYVEITILEAICPYCVASAVLMLVLFGISVSRLTELLAGT